MNKFGSFSVRLILKSGLIFAREVMPERVFDATFASCFNAYRILYRITYILGGALALPFLNDSKDIIRYKLTIKLLPYTLGGYKALHNAFSSVCFLNANGVAGDFVECGVARGGASAMMALADNHFPGPKRTYWLFDSFEGLPPPTKEDYIGNQTGEFIRPLGEGECLGTLDEVKTLFFRKLGLNEQCVNLVPGWFENTIPLEHSKIGKISLLRLDGDWYESTLLPLKFLFHKVTTGGIVIIDDYHTCYGSRKAVDDYFYENNLHYNLISDGRGGIWFRKD